MYLSIIGVRPEFLRLVAVHEELMRRGLEHVIVHSGQHYDYELSQAFFDEFNLPKPDHYLEVGSGTQGEQTARALERIERVLISEKPDIVFVDGDTNTTLAGALAAAKLNIPVAHREAGCRSFDRTMPEEVNRILTDHCSSYLFASTKASLKNLSAEGLTGEWLGDINVEMLARSREYAREHSRVLGKLGLGKGGYYLATIHRDFNTDSPKRLKEIFSAFSSLGKRVVIPLHPRTKSKLLESKLGFFLRDKNILFLEPLPHSDFVSLASNAAAILTDSGGVQKEAFLLKVPCVTIRPSTEWVETVEYGANTLSNADSKEIVEKVGEMESNTIRWDANPYGGGDSAKKIVGYLEDVI